MMMLPGRFKFLSLILGIATMGTGVYQWVFEGDLIFRSGDLNDTDMVVGIVALFAVFDSARRIMGWALPGICAAFLKGIDYLAKDPPDIVVFLDGDYSDFPEDLVSIIAPIVNKDARFVIGNRAKNLIEKGSLTPQQIFGNALACFLMRILYKGTFTDLGPFRAIGWEDLLLLEMQDKTYGWTIEMQLKVLRKKIPYIEIPVRYRKRIGVSKVSGTITGTLMAGYKILTWIGKFYFSKWK